MISNSILCTLCIYEDDTQALEIQERGLDIQILEPSTLMALKIMRLYKFTKGMNVNRGENLDFYNKY